MPRALLSIPFVPYNFSQDEDPEGISRYKKLTEEPLLRTLPADDQDRLDESVNFPRYVDSVMVAGDPYFILIAHYAGRFFFGETENATIYQAPSEVAFDFSYQGTPFDVQTYPGPFTELGDDSFFWTSYHLTLSTPVLGAAATYTTAYDVAPNFLDPVTLDFYGAGGGIESMPLDPVRNYGDQPPLKLIRRDTDLVVEGTDAVIQIGFSGTRQYVYDTNAPDTPSFRLIRSGPSFDIMQKDGIVIWCGAQAYEEGIDATNPVFVFPEVKALRSESDEMTPNDFQQVYDLSHLNALIRNLYEEDYMQFVCVIGSYFLAIGKSGRIYRRLWDDLKANISALEPEPTTYPVYTVNSKFLNYRFLDHSPYTLKVRVNGRVVTKTGEVFLALTGSGPTLLYTENGYDWNEQLLENATSLVTTDPPDYSMPDIDFTADAPAKDFYPFLPGAIRFIERNNDVKMMLLLPEDIGVHRTLRSFTNKLFDPGVPDFDEAWSTDYFVANPEALILTEGDTNAHIALSLYIGSTFRGTGTIHSRGQDGGKWFFQLGIDDPIPPSSSAPYNITHTIGLINLNVQNPDTFQPGYGFSIWWDYTVGKWYLFGGAGGVGAVNQIELDAGPANGQRTSIAFNADTGGVWVMFGSSWANGADPSGPPLVTIDTGTPYFVQFSAYSVEAPPSSEIIGAKGYWTYDDIDQPAGIAGFKAWNGQNLN